MCDKNKDNSFYKVYHLVICSKVIRYYHHNQLSYAFYKIARRNTEGWTHSITRYLRISNRLIPQLSYQSTLVDRIGVPPCPTILICLDSKRNHQSIIHLRDRLFCYFILQIKVTCALCLLIRKAIIELSHHVQFR